MGSSLEGNDDLQNAQSLVLWTLYKTQPPHTSVGSNIRGSLAGYMLLCKLKIVKMIFEITILKFIMSLGHLLKYGMRIWAHNKTQYELRVQQLSMGATCNYQKLMNVFI